MEAPGPRSQSHQDLTQELSWSEPIPIACVVTDEYVFDFVVLYESLVESWSAFPFVLHAFVCDPGTAEQLKDLELPGVEVHLEPGENPADWADAARRKPALVEESGLEKCIVSDVDNVFVAETPELFMLLDRYDFVFVGAPNGTIQTNLWSFRRNKETIDFSRLWEHLSVHPGTADALGLRSALVDPRSAKLEIVVVGVSQPKEGRILYRCPYDVQMNVRPSVLRSDPIGFTEAQMGRAKVIHVAGVRAKGNESVDARMSVLLNRSPQWSEFFPFYATLANRAANRLGREQIPNPPAYLQAQADRRGIIAHRSQLPGFLNRRRLLGRGVEVGVADGAFSDFILAQWTGRELVSVDPWLEAAPDEYRDVANVRQEVQDEKYDRAKARLARHGDRSSVWRMTSEEAAARIGDRSLDFVYVDARHDYDSVKHDLELWFDKVRPGGIFAGHDYVDGVRRWGVFGVKSAVDEFFATRGMTVGSTFLDAGWPTWFVEVPAGESQA